MDKYSTPISALSLILAYLSYRQAYKISNNTAQQLEELSIKHRNLIFALETTKVAQKYVKVLSACQLSSEKSLRYLASVALQTRKEVGEVFDFYDSQKFKTPYLRHSFHRATEIVRNAYDFELTYQTGLNLIERLRSLKFLDKDDIANHTQKTIHDFSILKFFKGNISNRLKPYFKISQHSQIEELHVDNERFEKPEIIINKNSEFWSHLKEIYNRIPEKDIPFLYSKAHNYLKKYCSEFDQIKNVLLKNTETLGQILQENELEPISLKDIPNLGDKFHHFYGKCSRLIHFDLIDIRALDEVFDSSGISILIYAGSCLAIVGSHMLWGEIRKNI